MACMKILFAPLQGYTEYAYRRAHSQLCGGVDCYLSPFLRLEYGQIRKRDLRDIGRDNNPYALVPQVIASSSQEFGLLADAALEQGYSHLNINMGCPFPPQVKAGRGAGLLQHPDRVREIMEASRKYAARGVHFSVKMRIGQESGDEGLEVMRILNDYSLDHITLHPRLGKQLYKGEASREAFGRFAEICNNPLVYNGDITSVEEIRAIEKAFPNLEGIMIGRGLLARPTLAAEYASGKAASDEEIRQAVLAIHRKVLDEYLHTLEGGGGQVLSKIQPFWEYPGWCFDRKLIKKLSRTGSLDAYIKTIEEL